MSTSKNVRDIIVAFAKEWGVPIAEVEQLTSQATIDRMASTKTADSWDNGTVFADEGFEPPKPSGNAVSQGTLSVHDTKEAEMLGRYQDLGLLGMGSMGEVRLVRDPDLRRTLAMKILHQRLMEKPRIVSRFIEEAQVEAQLQHRNIVPVHELGCLPNGRHYFTMKQIRGTEFSKKIQGVHQHSSQERWRKATDGTSFRDLIRIFQQVCETVAFAHSQGVIHRDLKPDNVMIGDFGEVLVVDWGLAKVLGRAEPEFHDEDQVETDRSTSQTHQTRMGTIAGTPCYMAPEQAFGHTEEVGTGTDVYTLGAILYEILSGTRPFQGVTVEEILNQVKHGLPPALRSVLDGNIEDREHEESASQGSDGTVPLLNKIPDRLAEICDQAMQREIGDRTNSAGVMAAELKGWLEGAEKRDKGLEEVALAQQLVEEAQNAEKASTLAWEEANRLIARDGACSVAGWASWDQHRDAAASGRLLRRRYVRRLQGALVHAPELEEAHEALAELCMEELVLAAALGDRLGQETLNQQLSAHLKFLSISAQQSIQECLKTRVADKISSQRLRRGTIVGRRLQREAVAAQVESGARLITVLGTAGVGKTRLALELAEDLRPEFSRAVFCNLTEATDPMEVMLHLSRALNVRLRDTDPAIHLQEVLSAQPTLLVLDNLEQIAAVVGSMITDWLRCCESLRVMGTSRQKLGIEKEVVVSVEPLSLLEGVDLFVRRGQIADQRFDFQPDNRETVCSLVNKLDGLPLAIELAAARLNIFDLDELLQRLDERFSLLRSRGRDSKGLDGALDWSWGLLEPWAKAALSQASLFRRGFTLEAAEGVIRVGDDAKIPGMFDILGALVDNSLMRNEQVEGWGVRYTLLESIRAYASDKLNVSGEDESDLLGPKAKIQTQHRHAAHFAQLGADDALKALDSFGGGARWEELFNELDNLVVGVEYGTSETAPYCCLAALKVLSMKGPMSLGIDVATDVLQREGLPKRVQMLIEIERSRCLRISGRLAEARQMVDTHISLLPRAFEAEADVDDLEIDASLSAPSLVEAERLMELGGVEQAQGNVEAAIQCVRTALDTFQKLGDITCEARAMGNLGSLYRTQGRYQDAIDFYRRAIELTRELGDRRVEGIHLGNLGATYQAKGQYDRAAASLKQAVDTARSVGDRRIEGINLGSLGGVYQGQGQHEQAIGLLTTALEIAREVGDRRNEGINMGNLGTSFFRLSRFEKAEDALRTAIPICDHASPMAAGVFRGTLALLLAHKDRIEEAKTVLQAGEKQIEPNRGEYAKFLCNKGHVQHLEGNDDSARSSLTRARVLAEELKVHDESEVAQAIQELETVLGFDAPDVSDEMRALALIEAERLLELGSIERAQNNLEPALDCFQKAVEIFRKHGDRTGEGCARGCVGNVLQVQGKWEQSSDYLSDAIEIFNQIGDQNREGIYLGNLGVVMVARGQMERAVECYSRAIDIARSLGDATNEGVFLGNLGDVYRTLGQYEPAATFFRQAIEIARQVGNKCSEGLHLGNLGDVLLGLEQSETAEAAFRTAISICDEAFPVAAGAFRGSLALLLTRKGAHEEVETLLQVGERLVVSVPAEHAKFLSKKGHIQQLLGDTDDAQASLKAAQVLASGLNVDHRSDVGQSITSLHDVITSTSIVDDEPSQVFVEAEQLQERGQIAYEQGQGDEAIRCFEGACDLHRKAGNRAGESRSLQNLGNVYSRIGDSDQAVALYQQALEISREEGNAVDEGGILASLATVHLNMDQYEQAEALYGQALKHHQDTGNRLAEGTVQGNLANLYIVKGNYPRAVDLLKLTIDIRREVGDKHGEGIDYGNLGDALFMLDKFDDAELAFERAIAICDEAVPPAAGVFRGSLALLLGHRGLFDEAMAVFEVGDALVAPIADEQIKFLCKKGQVLCQAGDASGAQETLMRARKRAGELKLKVDGELERALLALQDAIASVGSSEPEGLSTDHEIQMVVESEALQKLGEQALQTAHEKGKMKSLQYDGRAAEE